MARRGGILGVSFYQPHLRKAGRASLDDVVRHAFHLARAAGGPENVGLGTDLDGGFGVKYAALHDLIELKRVTGLLKRHFSRAQTEGIMGENWIAFLRRSLPD